MIWAACVFSAERFPCLTGEYQRILEPVGPGADHIPGYRQILADVQVQLHPVRPLRVVGDGIGIPGYLLAAARLQIETLTFCSAL